MLLPAHLVVGVFVTTGSGIVVLVVVVVVSPRPKSKLSTSVNVIITLVGLGGGRPGGVTAALVTTGGSLFWVWAGDSSGGGARAAGLADVGSLVSIGGGLMATDPDFG